MVLLKGFLLALSAFRLCWRHYAYNGVTTPICQMLTLVGLSV
jgi:hypothetical protein